MEKWDLDRVDVERRKSKALMTKEVKVSLLFEVSVGEC